MTPAPELTAYDSSAHRCVGVARRTTRQADAPHRQRCDTPRPLAAFDDAYMLASDCRQLHWTGAQLDALATLEDTLSAISAKDNGALWSMTSFQHAKEWQRVREQAALDQEPRYR